MARKFRRKGGNGSKPQPVLLVDEVLTLDDGSGQVIVRYDENDSTQAGIYYQALIASRKIIPSRQVNQFHEHVQKVMRITNGQVPLEAVLRNVQQWMEEQEGVAREDAVRLVLLERNFEQETLPTGIIVRFKDSSLLKEDPPDDWFDPYDEEEERDFILKTWTPMNPVPQRGQPVEIMVMLMETLLAENPLLSYRIDAAFGRIVERIALTMYGQGVVDHNGFRPLPVGGNLDEHARTDTGNKPNKRGKRTAAAPVRTDGQND